MARTGRPRFEPTEAHRELILDLALAGLSRDRIATHIRDANGKAISVATLERYFPEELTTAKEAALARTASNLYRISWGDSKAAVTAAIFLMKTQARWKETSAIEHSGPDGKPIATANVTDLTKDELDAELRANGIDPASI